MTTEGYSTADHTEAAIALGAPLEAVDLMNRVIKKSGGCDETSYCHLMQNLAFAKIHKDVASVQYTKKLGVSEEAALIASAYFANEEPKNAEDRKAFEDIARYAESLQNNKFQFRLKRSASTSDLLRL